MQAHAQLETSAGKLKELENNFQSMLREFGTESAKIQGQMDVLQSQNAELKHRLELTNQLKAMREADGALALANTTASGSLYSEKLLKDLASNGSLGTGGAGTNLGGRPAGAPLRRRASWAHMRTPV